jgi:hypothetical protein
MPCSLVERYQCFRETLPFTYNTLRVILTPSCFRSAACSGYSISVLFLGNISVPQKTTEILVSRGGGCSHKVALAPRKNLIYGAVTVIITNGDVVYCAKVPWNAFRACILLTNGKRIIHNARDFN